METTQITRLDVTVLDPRDKHPTIFRLFDGLNDGETLNIRNDHDPKPLYYQLLHERGKVFEWEYVEQGPIWWEVNITKRHYNASDVPVGELAAKDIRKAQVFKKYGIDFCCGGRKTLKEVCSEKGLNSADIEKELENVDAGKNGRPAAYNTWSLDFLADYIVNTHHTYVQKSLPDIQAYALKVAQVHGGHHKELLSIHHLVEELAIELTDHMAKEEHILFPFIKALVQAKKEGSKPNPSHFGTIKNPITMMENEHESAGTILQEIRTLSNDYTLPAEACASYSLLFRMLEEFEEDLHLHIHLENNILFPEAAKLEKELV